MSNLGGQDGNGLGGSSWSSLLLNTQVLLLSTQFLVFILFFPPPFWRPAVLPCFSLPLSLFLALPRSVFLSLLFSRCFFLSHTHASSPATLRFCLKFYESLHIKKSHLSVRACSYGSERAPVQARKRERGRERKCMCACKYACSKHVRQRSRVIKCTIFSDPTKLQTHNLALFFWLFLSLPPILSLSLSLSHTSPPLPSLTSTLRFYLYLFAFFHIKKIRS